MRPTLLAGPTASGKSSLALKFAKETGAKIVNADAIQVYDCWRVLAARPTQAEELQAEHALYGHVPAETPYSVGDWLVELEKEIADQPVIIVGGTGLYFSALTQGLARIPPISPETRSKGDALRAEGITALQTALAALDARAFSALDQRNPARLQRAWEVATQTGRSILDWQSATEPPRLPLDACLPVVLNSDPAWLNNRIEQRFDQMLQDGALGEAEAWRASGRDFSLPSSKAIGARELVAYLDGDITLEDARDAVKIATRQFAKRQRTWFRSRFPGWMQVRVDETGDGQTLVQDLITRARS